MVRTHTEPPADLRDGIRLAGAKGPVTKAVSQRSWHGAIRSVGHLAKQVVVRSLVAEPAPGLLEPHGMSVL